MGPLCLSVVLILTLIKGLQHCEAQFFDVDHRILNIVQGALLVRKGLLKGSSLYYTETVCVLDTPSDAYSSRCPGIIFFVYLFSEDHISGAFHDALTDGILVASIVNLLVILTAPVRLFYRQTTPYPCPNCSRSGM